jgi:hypothetical protein
MYSMIVRGHIAVSVRHPCCNASESKDRLQTVRRASPLSDAEEDMRFELGLSPKEAKRVANEVKALTARVRAGT